MLQTKDFAVTGVSSGGGITYTYILRFTELSVNPDKNTSRVRVEAILKQNYTGTAFYRWSTGVSCSAEGVSLFSDYRQRDLSGTGEHIYHTWEGDLSHDPDGRKTLKISGKLWQADPESYSPPAMTVTGEWTLTAIPRASKAGAADGAIGSRTTVVITPASPDFTHSLAFQFGNLTGYVSADGQVTEQEEILTGNTVSFAIPESFYWEIPDASSGDCTLTVTTYRGVTRLGSTQTHFRCIAEKSRCAPLITATVTDESELAKKLTGGEALVRYLSEVTCRLQKTFRWGAREVSATVNGQPIGSSLVLSSMETGVYVFRVVDSRGHETVETVTLPMVAYVPLTCHPVASRVAPTTGEVDLHVTGNGFAGSFGAENNQITGRFRVLPEETWQDLTLTFSGDQYTAQARLTGLDYTRSHMIEVWVEDKTELVSAQAVVQPGIPVFCWGKDYFRFHVPVQFAAGIIE